MSQRERIAALLSDMKWHRNTELNQICFRYGARIWELRHEYGWNIAVRNVPGKPGLVEYRYVGRYYL